MCRPVSVVVPLVPAHDRYLESLVEQLKSDAEVIDKVVLARSSARSGHVSVLANMAEELSNTHGMTIELLPTSRARLAGQNRNRGWERVTSPYTAFLDADDRYAPYRLQRLLEVAEDRASDLVLHDFITGIDDSIGFPDASWTGKDLIGTESLYLATFPEGRQRWKEGSVPGDTNVVVPFDASTPRGVHHGHIFVKTSLRREFSFGSLYPGEDGQFCRDVLWSKRSVTYVPARLSIYRSQLSAESESDFFRRRRRDLSSLARRLGVNAN